MGRRGCLNVARVESSYCTDLAAGFVWNRGGLPGSHHHGARPSDAMAERIFRWCWARDRCTPTLGQTEPIERDPTLTVGGTASIHNVGGGGTWRQGRWCGLRAADRRGGEDRTKFKTTSARVVSATVRLVLGETVEMDARNPANPNRDRVDYYHTCAQWRGAPASSR